MDSTVAGRCIIQGKVQLPLVWQVFSFQFTGLFYTPTLAHMCNLLGGLLNYYFYC